MGMTIEQIIDATQLSKEEIEKLSEEKWYHVLINQAKDNKSLAGILYIVYNPISFLIVSKPIPQIRKLQANIKLVLNNEMPI